MSHMSSMFILDGLSLEDDNEIAIFDPKEELQNMKRNGCWRRKQAYLHSKKKVDIIKNVYRSNYIKYNGSYYRKNKVHCGCGLCKPWKHYKKYDKFSIYRKKLEMDEEVKDYFQDEY